MTQTRTASALETSVSTGTGFLVSYALTMYLLPFWELKPTMTQAFEITIIYTLASLLRGYWIRRIFNRGKQVD